MLLEKKEFFLGRRKAKNLEYIITIPGKECNIFIMDFKSKYIKWGMENNPFGCAVDFRERIYQ